MSSSVVDLLDEELGIFRDGVVLAEFNPNDVVGYVLREPDRADRITTAINNSLYRVKAEIGPVAASQADSLLSTTTTIQRLESTIQPVATELNAIVSSVGRVEGTLGKVIKEYEEQVVQAIEISQSLSLLRQVIRWSALVKRLFDPATSDDNAATCVAELREMIANPELAKVNVVRSNEKNVGVKAEALRDAAVANITKGLEAKDQNIIGDALLVLHYLGNIDRVNGVLKKIATVSVSQIEQALSPGNFEGSTPSHRSSAGSGPGIARSSNPPVGQSSTWRVLLWNKVEEAFKHMQNHCMQAWLLCRVLSRKRDPLTYIPLQENSRVAPQQFWSNLVTGFSQQVVKSAQMSSFVNQTLTTEYPRLLLIVREFLDETARHADDIEFGEKQRNEILGALRQFEHAYLGMSLARLSNPVSNMFQEAQAQLNQLQQQRENPRDHVISQQLFQQGVGFDVMPTVTAIQQELQHVRFDPQLTLQVAKSVAKACKILASGAETARINTNESTLLYNRAIASANSSSSSGTGSSGSSGPSSGPSATSAGTSGHVMSQYQQQHQQQMQQQQQQQMQQPTPQQKTNLNLHNALRKVEDELRNIRAATVQQHTGTAHVQSALDKILNDGVRVLDEAASHISQNVLSGLVAAVRQVLISEVIADDYPSSAAQAGADGMQSLLDEAAARKKSLANYHFARFSDCLASLTKLITFAHQKLLSKYQSCESLSTQMQRTCTSICQLFVVLVSISRCNFALIAHQQQQQQQHASNNTSNNTSSNAGQTTDVLVQFFVGMEKLLVDCFAPAESTLLFVQFYIKAAKTLVMMDARELLHMCMRYFAQLGDDISQREAAAIVDPSGAGDVFALLIPRAVPFLLFFNFFVSKINTYFLFPFQFSAQHTFQKFVTLVIDYLGEFGEYWNIDELLVADKIRRKKGGPAVVPATPTLGLASADALSADGGAGAANNTSLNESLGLGDEIGGPGTPASLSASSAGPAGAGSGAGAGASEEHLIADELEKQQRARLEHYHKRKAQVADTIQLTLDHYVRVIDSKGIKQYHEVFPYLSSAFRAIMEKE